MESTVILIKPRAAERGIPEVVEVFLSGAELTVADAQPVVFTEDLMRAFAPHVKEHHLPELIAYLTEDVTTAWLVEGEDAVAKCLALREAIREQHQTVQPYTYIHASDSLEAAARERQVIFGAE